MNPRLDAINLTTTGHVIKPSDNVTLVVGPNNVGKSAVLTRAYQELQMTINEPAVPTPGPVDSVALQMPDATRLQEILLERGSLLQPGSYPQGTYYEPTFMLWNGASVPSSSIAAISGGVTRLGPMSGAVVTLLPPDGRGGVLQSQGLPDLMTAQSRSPLQMLWEDRTLEEQINAYMLRAFNQRVIVNRHAGANIHLHIGQVDIEEPRVGERTGYQDAIMQLPLLSQQGSGMQAFIGTMMTLATGTWDIVLLDEPETFLHPPQARLLGEIVAEFSKADGPQVIVATHSDDFVQGVINASRDDGDVTIVRLTRPSVSENRVAQVNADAVKSLYKDPLLRYSNIMDGIFYKGVVLCEAESDCTYYAATLGHLEDKDKLGSSDLLFTQCGGKSRLKKAYLALNAAAVPTAVVADIDILANKQEFKALFEGMGGDFEVIAASYNVLESSVRNQAITPKRQSARDTIEKALSASTQQLLSKQEQTTITDAVRSESGWKQIKNKGAGAIDSGDPTAAFNSILAACKAQGLFIVFVGELERFHSEISGNKQEWLRKVLENETFKDTSDSHNFLIGIREFITESQ